MVSEKKNEIVKKEEPSFSMMLTSGLQENKDALPPDFNVARFVQNSVALLNNNKTLSEFSKRRGIAPIKAGLFRGAYLGLDALNTEFHLIPYGDDLQFIVDYRGAVKLMKKYSVKPVAEIYAEVVKQGDDYSREIIDGEHHVNFKPKPFNEGVVIGAFAVCRFKDGTMIVEELTKAELEKIRSKSKMSNGMAWKDFTNEMYKKSALHRLKKRVSLDFDNPSQKQIFDEDGAIELGRSTEEIPNAFDDEPNEVFVEAEVVEEKISEPAEDVIEEECELPDWLKAE